MLTYIRFYYILYTFAFCAFCYSQNEDDADSIKNIIFNNSCSTINQKISILKIINNEISNNSWTNYSEESRINLINILIDKIEMAITNKENYIPEQAVQSMVKIDTNAAVIIAQKRVAALWPKNIRATMANTILHNQINLHIQINLHLDCLRRYPKESSVTTIQSLLLKSRPKGVAASALRSLKYLCEHYNRRQEYITFIENNNLFEISLHLEDDRIDKLDPDIERLIISNMVLPKIDITNIAHEVYIELQRTDSNIQSYIGVYSNRYNTGED